MTSFPFITVDVFTDRRFGGNPLAVFPDATGLTASDMQSLAAEFNLSETTFIFPSVGKTDLYQARIFNRTAEMPFAGHPTLGAAFALAHLGLVSGESVALDVPAGRVRVRIDRDADGRVQGGVVAAPQVLQLGETFPPATIAACASIDPADIVTTGHPPILASVGNPYVIAEVTPEALSRAAPDINAFRSAADARPHLDGRLSVHLYARSSPLVRARMFAPLAGTFEDPATGSANAPLAALLLSLKGGESEHALDVVQGVEMGRPSLLRMTAHRAVDGIRATVGGRCVQVLRGEALL